MSNLIKPLILLVLLAVTSALHAQQEEIIDSTIADDEERPVKVLPDDKYKFGIKIGGQFSTIVGAENENNTLRFGVNGGLYMRKKFKNEKWGYQIELNGSLRGSNYNSTKDDYSALRLVYVDLPTYLFVNLTKDQNQKVLVGPQFSYLLSSSLYKGTSNLAYNQEPSLVNHDILACAGYQIRLGHVSIQSVFKFGFVNINDGLLPEATPKNKGQNMNNILLEVNLLF
jgi:hypothetical protein